ncbi:DUF4760 domain-containing protein [Roseobacter sp. OBYS 0001]|uniref:DUF4760 domain-containing protein n=1 Tax=Roseobacter sp. OBYS 0001 TaxID=882651 RepID=UPI001C81B9C9|nr:DUF4760 domain-containing protein [Roseobacter sp. OBYS 0001]
MNEATQTIVCVASSFSYLSLAGPVVIAVSACIAFAGYRASTAMARKRATIDLIEKVESTILYRKMQSTFMYHREEGTLKNLNDPKNERDRQDRKDIQDFLNHYELVSIGIKSDILDKGIYIKWMGGPFVRDWNAATDFIQRERWKEDDKSPSGFRYHSDLLP